MRQVPTYRRILHIDLTPFFVGVERARNPSLHGRALIIGAVCERGRVAGMSEEARAAGVEVGQPTALAQRLCPEAALLPGDLDAYARASDQLTAILTALTPRVERPSTDEALLDLSTAAGTMRRALAVTESVRDVIRQRLGLDCSFGLGGSRLAARIASRWARPRGLLLLLPSQEEAFIRRQALTMLDDLPPRAAATLTQAGVATLGAVRSAAPEKLSALVGRTTAERLRASLDPGLDPPIAPLAPPHSIDEDLPLREQAPDAQALARLLDALTLRAARRLAAFQVDAQGVGVEVRRGAVWLRRAERFAIAVRDAADLQLVTRRLAATLIEPASGVRALRVRLTPSVRASPQYALFPPMPATAHA